MATMTTTGRPRQSLADQIDRLERILTGLREAVCESVADAVKDALEPAVRAAVAEALAERARAAAATGRGVREEPAPAVGRAVAAVWQAVADWGAALLAGTDRRTRIAAVVAGVPVAVGCALVGPAGGAMVGGPATAAGTLFGRAACPRRIGGLDADSHA